MTDGRAILLLIIVFLPSLALPCLALSCLALPFLVLPCLVVSCRVLSCLALSCRVVSCLVLYSSQISQHIVYFIFSTLIAIAFSFSSTKGVEFFDEKLSSLCMSWLIDHGKYFVLTTIS